MTSSPMDSRERGSFLLVVLAIGAVVIMVASTTLLSLRNSSKVSGTQRRDYQDLHAAEAGFIRMQNRLNSAASLCNGWFSTADSNAIIAAMTPTVDSLPSAYGKTRAARSHTFSVQPGRPMRIKYASTGGRYSGSAFDSSSSHTIRGTLRMSTMADFAVFSVLPLKIGAGATWYGKVHGDSVHVGANVTFNHEVTYVRGLDYQDPPGTFNDPNSVTFKRGKRKLTSNPFSLSRIFISNSETGRPTCSGSPAKTYEDLAAGAVSGEKKGFSYTGTAGRVYISLDSIGPKTISGVPHVKWRVYSYDGTKRPPKGTTTLDFDSVPESNFNGVAYVRGDAFISGTLSRYSLTIASSADIYATDNITCVGNDTINQDLRVTLGLIAASDIRIWRRSPTSITVEAAVVAKGGWYTADTNAGGNSYIDTSHYGISRAGVACPVIDYGSPTHKSYHDTCWNLKLLGGFITNNGGSSGPWYKHGLGTHTSRSYSYDDDNLYSPPPKFPALWGQNSAIPLWQAVSVGEN